MATSTKITGSGRPYSVGAASPRIGRRISAELMNTGRYPVTRTECGKARKTSATIKIQKASFMRDLAKPKPARVPTVSDIETTPAVTIIEFRKLR